MKTIAIVRFKPKAKLTEGEYRASLQKMMPMLEGAEGLNRKYFCAGEKESAGIYEWQSRGQAEAFYNGVGLKLMRQIAIDYSVELLSVRARLDNEAGSIDYYA